jgi:hypothetical protein
LFSFITISISVSFCVLLIFVYSFFFRLRVANKLLLPVAEYLSPGQLTTNHHFHYITAAAAAVAVSRLSFCFLDLVRRVFENLNKPDPDV